ncbi:class I SAM-dependent methyltransferase [Mycobacterium intracellulare]|uniref:Class I SAM-dependent methyltransferase n=1 Tax=Mycobacterium intracellulare TaxID=1767 RepID=A0AAE4RIJ3_MYCIT|nr:class I SAM-dependent methyltransferase [Mycobacterium intracellulare]MCA2321184.1 class I SAM-dependent methyltransferase [Mycobacterium intracellulare]MCA2341468.1 class I SAM-dependent methyltransferase [Mycobacterium intracellulare]MDV6979148.1 class I SAM-dependent methyltransferase [Mycobacterium intracellulare]MDV6984606.1 class I SAM-dependent methyltransferase [Mycobacterium intracellulare]MDV7014709.1 class I SAM-dependent methyltransferase [Mycobacterium intracellulare]
MSIANRLLFTPSRRSLAKYSYFLWNWYNSTLSRYWYPLATRYSSTDNQVFLSWGYEEDPPMALRLMRADEADRYFIQLYHRVATQVDLTGKRVLEVSCGHGGGASYLVRTLGPASYTGLDLNSAGIDFCRKRYQLPELEFVQGNAEHLPFDDRSFDVVINVEASHGYADIARFLAEVARVLNPGGHFLYADVRRRQDVANWERELGDAPMRLMSERVINEQVARGVEKNLPVLKDQSRLPEFITGRLFGNIFQKLKDGQLIYRMYCFAID